MIIAINDSLPAEVRWHLITDLTTCDWVYVGDVHLGATGND